MCFNNASQGPPNTIKQTGQDRDEALQGGTKSHYKERTTQNKHNTYERANVIAAIIFPPRRYVPRFLSL